MEIGNLPEKEFRIMRVTIIQDLGKRTEAKIKMREMFTKDLEELEIKEMNNTLQGINSRITEAEEWINDLEYRMVEITATEQNIEKRMKRNKDNLRDLWDNLNAPTFSLQGSQKEKEERKDLRKYLKR